MLIGAVIVGSSGPSTSDIEAVLSSVIIVSNATEPVVKTIHSLALHGKIAATIGGILIGLGLACFLGLFVLARLGPPGGRPQVVYVPVVRYLEPHIREVLNANEATRVALQCLPPTVMQRIIPLQTQIQMSGESRGGR